MYRPTMSRWVLAAITALLFSGSVSLAAEPGDVKGLYLIASYPAVTVAAGKTATVAIKLRNYNVAPEIANLSVTGLPAGWKASFVGNNQTVEAAMPATGKAVDLQLRIAVPKGAEGGAAQLVLHADGTTQHASLPLKITLGNSLPVALTLKPELPSLKGSPSTSFSYTLDLNNDSGVDLVVSLAAQAPPNFEATFTKQYASQEISSLPVKAGHSETLSMKVNLPNTIKAGTYRLVASVSGGGVTAAVPLSLEVVGQPKLALTTKTGRLSGDAEAGAATAIALVVENTGSAPARNISFSDSSPDKWKVTFSPAKLPVLPPGAKRSIQALVTPSDKAVAGDYVATFNANAEGNSTSADYRVTVTTSTLWGIVGIAIIAVALLAVLGVVARFGRR